MRQLFQEDTHEVISNINSKQRKRASVGTQVNERNQAISRQDIREKILTNDRICSRHFLSDKIAAATALHTFFCRNSDFA